MVGKQRGDGKNGHNIVFLKVYLLGYFLSVCCSWHMSQCVPPRGPGEWQCACTDGKKMPLCTTRWVSREFLVCEPLGCCKSLGAVCLMFWVCSRGVQTPRIASPVPWVCSLSSFHESFLRNLYVPEWNRVFILESLSAFLMTVSFPLSVRRIAVSDTFLSSILFVVLFFYIVLFVGPNFS